MARSRQVYTQRINRVLDHINTHLDGDLSVTRLAQIAGFSPFHFHHIFRGQTGETVAGYARRIRLERAASLMKASPRARVTDVALEAGFAGLAEFSRAFKAHFGCSPSAWDRTNDLTENRKNCKALGEMPSYTVEELDGLRGQIQVKLRRIPTSSFVFIRVADPYGSNRLLDAYHKLIGWIRTRGMSHLDGMIVGMQQDDPSITEASKCRYDMGFLFPIQGCRNDLVADTLRQRSRKPATAISNLSRQERTDYGLSVREFPECQVATVHCQGDLAAVDQCWQYLYRSWLPQSAYDPADLPAMELFVQTPEEIGWTTFDLIAAIPLASYPRVAR